MSKQDTYLASIREAYPDLDVASVEFNDRGQNSDVVLVNGQIVFRFPKYLHVLESLRTEMAILEAVQSHVPLPVPAPAFANLHQTTVGDAFLGYQLIPGEPLWRDTFRAIDSQDTVRSLANQVASFLRALHGVAVEEVIGVELPVYDTSEEWMDIYARIREKLFGYMRPDAREWVTTHFEGFLSETGKFKPVLKHGDFGPSNILFDEGIQRVTGVIDFGGSGLGDPAYDFAGLLSGYGEDFVRSCINVYPEVEGFLDRIRFYQGTFALLEALFGVENDDERALKAGLERYV